MDGKSCSHLPPPLPSEGSSMANVFATAIGSISAKREAQFKFLAMALDVLNTQGIILIGASFSASVPSEQVDPRSTDAGLKGSRFVHGSGADSARFGIKGRYFRPTSRLSSLASPCPANLEQAACPRSSNWERSRRTSSNCQERSFCPSWFKITAAA